MATEPIPVSVIIVSYNTCDLLRACLASVEDCAEVIVVDNDSHDGSVEMVRSSFPSVRVIENDHNLGFGVANNLGLRIASQPIVLLLNSDAQATPGSVSRLISCFEDQNVVAAGGKLTFPDGRLQESAASELTLWRVFCEQFWLERLLPGSRFFNGYWQSRRLSDRQTPADVEQVMGACLMMRSGTEFDERFFLYVEDTDLCRRLRRRGRILYDPNAVFIHALGASSNDPGRWLAVARYNRGKELYFSIHHGQAASVFCLVLDRLGAGLRIFAWIVVAPVLMMRDRRFPPQIGWFCRVLVAPVRLRSGTSPR